MLDVQVVAEAGSAAQLLDPVRRRLLAAMVEPRSAAQLAAGLGLSRQKVNYHMRVLQRNGLAEEVEQRRWGGITERLMMATAASYVVSTEALGELGSDPGLVADRLSARYLIALAARTVREVGLLVRRADAQDKQVATLSIDVEIGFASAADRVTFAGDLSAAVRSLVARHHSATAPGSRVHRVVVGVHPLPGSADEIRAAGQPR